MGLQAQRTSGGWRLQFAAMASPCEVLVDTDDGDLARACGVMAMTEAQRIERRFSRYRPDSLVHQINHADGLPLELDAETADLIDFAVLMWQLSDGLFDITSGILRKVWHFDGSDGVPTPAAVRQWLPLVGWDQVVWQRPWLTLRPGMEIDLGGIGKEYAVDRVARLLTDNGAPPTLINFGGDLYASAPRRDGSAWQVAIEATRHQTEHRLIALSRGGLATSGDSRRYLEADGVRYSHILNPRTGWPVVDAPASVSVAADSCLQAGMLATLASLQGPQARAFLESQQVPCWLSES